MSLFIKNLIQKVRNKLNELQSLPIANIYDIDIEQQQTIEKYNNILNILRFIDYYNVNILPPKKIYTSVKNDDVFRLAHKLYGNYELAENILLDNDFHDLLPEPQTEIFIKE